jgi:hypothetical protein
MTLRMAVAGYGDIKPGVLSDFFAQAQQGFIKPLNVPRPVFSPENIFTVTLGNLPRWIQNMADALCDMGMHVSEEDALDSTASSICGTAHAKEASRFRTYKRRKKRRRVTYADLLREAQEHEDAINSIQQSIDNLEDYITRMRNFISAIGAHEIFTNEQNDLDTQLYKLDTYRYRIRDNQITAKEDIAFLREKLFRRVRAVRKVKSRILNAAAVLWPESEYDSGPQLSVDD